MTEVFSGSSCYSTIIDLLHYLWFCFIIYGFVSCINVSWRHMHVHVHAVASLQYIYMQCYAYEFAADIE
jgi:hypothetical protein